MSVTTSGFEELESQLQRLVDASRSPELRTVAVEAMEPIRDSIIANVHSVTGRTVGAVTVMAGRGDTVSAYVKVDGEIAYAMSRGRRVVYPRYVESGHGGPHPAPEHPFFRPAYLATRAESRSIVRDGIEKLMDPYKTT